VWLQYVERRWTEDKTHGLEPQWIYRRARTGERATLARQDEARRIAATWRSCQNFYVLQQGDIRASYRCYNKQVARGTVHGLLMGPWEELR
jgi:hypothetical protein